VPLEGYEDGSSFLLRYLTIGWLVHADEPRNAGNLTADVPVSWADPTRQGSGWDEV
jgi:hypothetical protein